MAPYYIGLSLLSNNHPTSIQSAHRELLSAEGRRILSLLSASSIKENDIAKEENGRPFFRDYRADFNVSHSGAAVAVSLVYTKKMHGKKPRGPAPKSGRTEVHFRTGCDIQLVRKRKNIRKIVEEFFSQTENDYIFSQHKPIDNIARFFQIWTLKECYLKLRGLSVFDMRSAPSFVSGEADSFVFETAASTQITFNLYELEGQYILASAIEGICQAAPEIRWFSQESLFCKNIAEIIS